jgi:hypothetical protein
MHQCPECGDTCDCDAGNADVLECRHFCEMFDDDYDHDY